MVSASDIAYRAGFNASVPTVAQTEQLDIACLVASAELTQLTDPAELNNPLFIEAVTRLAVRLYKTGDKSPLGFTTADGVRLFDSDNRDIYALLNTIRAIPIA